MLILMHSNPKCLSFVFKFNLYEVNKYNAFHNRNLGTIWYSPPQPHSPASVNYELLIQFATNVCIQYLT